MNAKLRALRQPIVPQRVRRIAKQPFAFIPFRFLRDGFLADLERDELALYVLLVLAGNRDGVSFYRHDAICSILQLTLDDYIAARNNLIHKDLIAFDGNRFQVLSLPIPPLKKQTKPLRNEDDFNNHDPATIRAIVRDSLDLNDFET